MSIYEGRKMNIKVKKMYHDRGTKWRLKKRRRKKQGTYIRALVM